MRQFNGNGSQGRRGGQGRGRGRGMGQGARLGFGRGNGYCIGRGLGMGFGRNRFYDNDLEQTVLSSAPTTPAIQLSKEEQILVLEKKLDDLQCAYNDVKSALNLLKSEAV